MGHKPLIFIKKKISHLWHDYCLANARIYSPREDVMRISRKSVMAGAFVSFATVAVAGVAHAGPMDPGYASGAFVFNFNESGSASQSVNGGPFTPVTGNLMFNPSNVEL